MNKRRDTYILIWINPRGMDRVAMWYFHPVLFLSLFSCVCVCVYREPLPTPKCLTLLKILFEEVWGKRCSPKEPFIFLVCICLFAERRQEENGWQ